MALTNAEIKQIRKDVEKYRTSAAGAASANPVKLFCLILPLVEAVLQAIEDLFPQTKDTIEKIIKGLDEVKKVACKKS